ncbi:MAG: peptide chain release factor N(5)-glutamine methyltransferase [Eubacteriales bacterium]
MTLKDALDYGKANLVKADIQEANLDAWYLLEYVSHVSRATYYGNPDYILEEEQETLYKEVIAQRCKRIPLQHITGVQEFMGFVFRVNEHVLIPRQDTEILVETALDHIPKDLTRRENTSEKIKVLDMCTGSGCILISLMQMRETIEGTGVDISKEALKVAKMNADLNHVSCSFIESDLFENIEGRYDVIVSNPPYIRTQVIEELEEEVKLHDPMLALDGREDGIYFYKKIIESAREYLNPEGMLFFEIGHDQGEVVANEMRNQKFLEVKVKKDLAGLDRVVYGHVQ